MARSYRILGQKNPAANQLTTLYTVPASNSAIISSLVIASLNETEGTGNSFSVAVNVSGVTVANSNYVAYRVNCPTRDTVTMTLGITLNAGSNISVSSNSSLLNFTAFGTEVY
jgi:hypothetical protein